MAITGILASLIGFSLLAFILAKSQKYYEIQQKELGNLNGHIEEAYSGHNVVKVYNNVENSKDEFEKINEKMFFSFKALQREKYAKSLCWGDCV